MVRLHRLDAGVGFLLLRNTCLLQVMREQYSRTDHDDRKPCPQVFRIQGKEVHANTALSMVAMARCVQPGPFTPQPGICV